MDLWARVQASGAGEPGFYFSNDKDWGTNPCCEIGLRPYQFCNLTEVNVSNIDSQEEYEARVKAATFIGTLQASYTDFHYLRDVWRRNTEKDALIGVSMTGIASGAVLALDMKKAAKVVKEENKRVAELIGIRQAARTTCVKPAGTTSLTLGTSSGIHAWHNDYYIRRLRVGKNESIYTHLAIYHPELLEDEYFRPHDTAVISVPQSAPSGAITRNENAMDLLNRVKKVSGEWVKFGHRKGQNTHNVSATIAIRESEWDEVGEWMWENRDVYNGLAVLPHDGGTYVQAPFEDCSEEEYKQLVSSLAEINLRKVVELEDNTDLKGEVACSGGSCEII
jgi:ribonucleoside-diphosphate reductase alpha chain